MEQNKHINKIIGILIGIFGIGITITVSILGLRKPIDSSVSQSQDTQASVQSSATSQDSTVQPDTTTVASPVSVYTPQLITTPKPQATKKSTTRTSTSTPVSTPKSAPEALPPKPIVRSVYKNGTYSATGSYMSPGGMDQLRVTVTLSNDIITGTSVITEANDRTSQYYQNIFASNYKQYVVGKNISSIYLTRVSGSSLTPQGFNDALNQIESHAKA